MQCKLNLTSANFRLGRSDRTPGERIFVATTWIWISNRKVRHRRLLLPMEGKGTISGPTLLGIFLCLESFHVAPTHCPWLLTFLFLPLQCAPIVEFKLLLCVWNGCVALLMDLTMGECNPKAYVAHFPHISCSIFKLRRLCNQFVPVIAPSRGLLVAWLVRKLHRRVDGPLARMD